MDRQRDAFAIFNDGVDKILEAMEPCRDSLRQWKDQKQRIEDEIDKSNQHWDKKISQIEDEIKQKEDENTDLKKKFENDSKQREQEAETEKGKLKAEEEAALSNCQADREGAESKLLELKQEIEKIRKNRGEIKTYTPEGIEKLTNDFCNNEDEFKKRQDQYVLLNQDKKLAEEAYEYTKRKASLNRTIEKEGITCLTAPKAARQVRESWQGRIGGGLSILAERFGEVESIEADPKLAGEAAAKIEKSKAAFVEKDVELMLEGKRVEDAAKLSEVNKNYQNNMGKKEMLKTTARWILCFPVNIVQSSLSIRSKVMDYVGIGMAVMVSCIMISNPEILGFLIGATVLCGLVYGIFLGFQRRAWGGGMTVGIFAGVGKAALITLPYPILVYMITRSLMLWMLWLGTGLSLYFLYDLYYAARKLRPSYRKAQEQYVQQRNAYYDQCIQVLNEYWEDYKSACTRIEGEINQELEGYQRQVDRLENEIAHKERELRLEFVENQWDNIVDGYQKWLEEIRQADIKKATELDEALKELRGQETEWQGKLKSIKKAERSVKKKIGYRADQIDKGLEQENDRAERIFQRKQGEINGKIGELQGKLEIERNNKEQAGEIIRKKGEAEERRLKNEFSKKLEEVKTQMKENGFKKVCGFDYRETWAVIHGMTANLISYPANMRLYSIEDDKPTMVQSLMAEELDVDKRKLQQREADEKGCFMPENIPWELMRCGEDELGKEIQAGLEEVLKDEEIFRIEGWDDARYGIHKPPTDALYRLKMTDTNGGPILLYYDLGDMVLRENCMDLLKFVMKNFVYRPYFYSGADEDNFTCDILVSDYESYLKEFEEFFPLKEKKFVSISGKGQFSHTLEALREKAERTRNGLGKYSNLREKNAQRFKKGDSLSGSDSYRSLVLVNIDYKALENTCLEELMRYSYSKEQGNLGGVYPCLMVDLHRLRNRNGEIDNVSIKYCKRLINGFEGKVCELTKDKGQYCVREAKTEEFASKLEDIV